jgi:hypothetical protein
MLWHRLNRRILLIGTVGVLLALGGLNDICSAAPIFYPDINNVGGSGISFTNIKEDSSTDTPPLFGAPNAFVIGMDFDPSGFGSTSSAGSPSPEITDGQLNFTIGASGVAIDTFTIFESGDYTLFAAPPGAFSPVSTTANVILQISVWATQIDGVDVVGPPIPLPNLSGTVSFNLLANPGSDFWSLSRTYDVDAALTSVGRTFALGATKLEVAIDNKLITTSTAAQQTFTSSLATIAKKDFSVDVETKIPEPATLILLLGGCLALAEVGWRTRS